LRKEVQTMAMDDDMQTFRTKVRTNGDRIRAMDDEQLADAITADAFCSKVTGEIATISDCSDRKCIDCVLQWLREEAES